MVDLSITLPDSFFEEEDFQGVHITRKIKEVQAIQLNIWQEVDRICKKYDIPYWADGGTLLGAVRHGGFIPWDYDMDLMMRRYEYNRFIEICKKELHTPFQLVCGRFIKIKDSRTFMTRVKRIPKNIQKDCCGIFIDIFPFDNIGTEPTEITKIVKETQEMVEFLMNDNGKILKHPNTDLFRKKLTKKCESLDKTKNGYICNLVVPYHKGCIKSLVDFKTTTYLKFESFDIPVPVNMENVLRDLFGNWRKPKLYKMNETYYANTDATFEELNKNKINWEKEKLINAG